jgi:hypothetical protein
MKPLIQLKAGVSEYLTIIIVRMDICIAYWIRQNNRAARPGMVGTMVWNIPRKHNPQQRMTRNEYLQRAIPTPKTPDW